MLTPIRDIEADRVALLALKSEPQDVFWAGYTTGPDPTQFTHWYNQQLLRSDRKVWLARLIDDTEKIVGYLYITSLIEGDEKIALLSHGISEAYSGKGFGTQLVTFGVNYWLNNLAEEISAISAWILRNNEASIRTFQKNGFRITEKQKLLPEILEGRTPLMINYQFRYA